MRRPTTLDEFWAIPEEARFHELLSGELTPKTAPSGEHGDAQGGVIVAIRAPFQRPSSGAAGRVAGGS